MPRRAKRRVVANAASSPALKSRDVRLTELLGTLAHRAGTWGWLATYQRVRRGESVPRWHLGMMRLTAAKRRGEFRRPEKSDDE